MRRRIEVTVIPVLFTLVLGALLWVHANTQTETVSGSVVTISPDTAPGAADIEPLSRTSGGLTHSSFAGPVSNTQAITIPILMYHHVGNPNTYPTYSVDTMMFDWQMDTLEKQGFHSVSIDAIALALSGGAPLPDKPIAITFDDGWVLQITNTLPILLRHHFRATYYIIVNVTGRRPANMSWDQVRQLRDAGMWIGSHTLSHGYLPGMSDKRLQDELAGSKQSLEQRLGIAVTTLAYPGGAFNARVERAARDAGYRAALTVLKGYNQTGDALYRLQRVGVYGVDTQERFIAKVDQTFFNKTWPLPHGQATLTDPLPEQ